MKERQRAPLRFYPEWTNHLHEVATRSWVINTMALCPLASRWITGVSTAPPWTQLGWSGWFSAADAPLAASGGGKGVAPLAPRLCPMEAYPVHSLRRIRRAPKAPTQGTAAAGWLGWTKGWWCNRPGRAACGAAVAPLYQYPWWFGVSWTTPHFHQEGPY